MIACMKAIRKKRDEVLIPAPDSPLFFFFYDFSLSSSKPRSTERKREMW